MAKCIHNFKKIKDGTSEMYQVYECKKCQKENLNQNLKCKLNKRTAHNENQNY
jgi:hypothetical protein